MTRTCTVSVRKRRKRTKDLANLSTKRSMDVTNNADVMKPFLMSYSDFRRLLIL